jgi:hypothetical protein
MLLLYFSDGSQGDWSADAILARRTVMTVPLEDEAFFRRAFIEAGTLAWPNGLGFSARFLRGELERQGRLVRAQAT